MQTLESIPLFPLPGHVLLPGLTVPLHVFEPRYRALVGYLMDLSPDRRWLAVPRIAPGHEPEAMGSPPLVPVVAAARLVGCNRLPDGRFLIALVGEGRWRLTELDSTQPYRLARLDRLPEPLPTDDLAGKAAAAVRRHLGPIPAVPDEVICMLDAGHHPPEVVLDRLASLTLVDPDLRQRYLEAESACCRLRVLEGAESRCGSSGLPTMN